MPSEYCWLGWTKNRAGVAHHVAGVAHYVAGVAHHVAAVFHHVAGVAHHVTDVARHVADVSLGPESKNAYDQVLTCLLRYIIEIFNCLPYIFTVFILLC